MKFEKKEAISILERTPVILKTYLQGLSKEWTMQNEGENTWSPYDVVGHFIHGELTDWIPRANIILSDDENKAFEPYDRFAQKENSIGKTMQDLLYEFENLRKENIKLLKGMDLSEKNLKREGIHPEFGNITLEQLLSAWVVHDLGHIVQISRVMARQYTQAVGPWSKYLTVL